jgi:putative hydrolase of the HAD superfamily
MPLRAVLWDFGGVISESPFDAFGRYEEASGLAPGTIRALNSTNPDTNAWAQMERNSVTMDEFFDLFEAEALSAGHKVDARAILSLLSGALRPEMIEAVRRCAERIPTGLVTNNFVTEDATSGPGDIRAGEGPRSEMLAVMAHFHVVIESSKVGLRKPDPRIYQLACDALGVAPSETVFLDDLGINLKPARALGMHTIKVIDPALALTELETAIGFPVRPI